MFEKLFEFFNGNLTKTLTTMAALSGSTFIANVVQTFSDGVVTHDEIQALISSALGIETVVLLVIVVYLRKKK